jgi:hypothetical protein
MKAGHGRVDYLLYVDRKVVGVIEAKPEGHDPVGRRVAVRGVRHRSAGGGGAEVGHRRRAAAVRFRGQRVGDPLHQRLRPSPAGSTHLQLPEASDSRQAQIRDAEADPDSRRGVPRSAPAATRRSAAAPSPDHRDQRHRAEPRRAALRPVARPDGHGSRQDVHSGHRGIPAAEVRRLPTDPVPRRPQQPGRADDRRVPELPHPRRRAPLHRALQRRQADQRRDAWLLATSSSPRSSGSSRCCGAGRHRGR